MQGSFNNSMPPQGYNNMPQQGIQSQGYQPNAYPYNAAASAYNYYNASEYPCNQYTNPAAFGQQGHTGFKEKIKNFFRFGAPQPQVLLGPDGHPLPSAYVAPNEPHARRQKYVQDRAQIDDFLGQVEFNRSRQVHHKNLHGFEYRADEGPAAGNIGPAPFPQQHVGTGYNMAGPGPYPQQVSGQFNQGFVQQQGIPSQGPIVQQRMPSQGFVQQQPRMPSQEFVHQQGFSQAPMHQHQAPIHQQGFSQAPIHQQGSPLRRGEFAPAPAGFNQGPAGMQRTTVEVKNLPNGGFEEKKETFRREEYITKASKPAEDKTMSEKLGDKMADAKEWVSDKISGSDPKETKESERADGMAKPEKVGKDLVESEDKKTQEIISEGQKANH